MGCSIVTMWHGRLLFTWSTSALSVVVVPDPVGPVTSTRPRPSAQSLSRTGGSPSSPADGSPGTTRRQFRARLPRWR